MLSDRLDKLHKGHEYKYSGPVPGITPQRVFDTLSRECRRAFDVGRNKRCVSEIKKSHLIALLRQQAEEIAEAGHAGWGNTMNEAADALQTDRLAEEKAREALRFTIEVIDIVIKYRTTNGQHNAKMAKAREALALLKEDHGTT